MDTRYHYVNDLQESGLIKVKFVRSEDNVLDIATKNVASDLMRKHEGKLMADKEYWLQE